jgi:hypothetical protein
MSAASEAIAKKYCRKEQKLSKKTDKTLAKLFADKI